VGVELGALDVGGHAVLGIGEAVGLMVVVDQGPPGLRRGAIPSALTQQAERTEAA
jgi:hypothetical protein